MKICLHALVSKTNKQTNKKSHLKRPVAMHAPPAPPHLEVHTKTHSHADILTPSRSFTCCFDSSDLFQQDSNRALQHTLCINDVRRKQSLCHTFFSFINSLCISHGAGYTCVFTHACLVCMCVCLY